eukprot:COSAG02_NODE_2251_length_9362_cov_19.062075_2_plen_211_part_00
MAASIKLDWIGRAEGNRQDFYHTIDVAERQKLLSDTVRETLVVLEQGTSKAVTRVVVVTGHTDQVGKILFQIANENIGHTVDRTCYVLTTDSVPLPSLIGQRDWPANMQSGLFAIVAASPDVASADLHEDSYNYQQIWDHVSPTWLGYEPSDTDNDRSTIHTYGWHSHDAVVAIASAYHRIKEGVNINSSRKPYTATSRFATTTLESRQN